MRISDWSSDVCSSDLDRLDDARGFMAGDRGEGVRIGAVDEMQIRMAKPARDGADTHLVRVDRKSVVQGKSVSVRVDLGGRRIIKKKKHIMNTTHATQTT